MTSININKYHRIGEMFYKDIDNDLWQFELHTTPPEALYWKNYKIRLEDIKVISKASKQLRDKIKKEILKDIKLQDTKEPREIRRWK